jgi:hypothetical protein
MKPFRCRDLGLIALGFTLTLHAQILVQPQNQTMAGTGVSNLRILKQSADGTETILTVDFTYDGVHGPSVRLLPVITDKKQPKEMSGWFGANPVTVGRGHGTVSLRVKFFNDDPGVPPQVTTDHVRILMMSDNGRAVLSQGIFARTINWGSAKTPAVTAPAPESQNQISRLAEEKARADDEIQRLADEKAKADADAKARQEARLKAEAKAEAERLAEEKAKAEADAKRLAEEKTKAEAEAKRLSEEKSKAVAAAPAAQAAPASKKTAFAISSKAKSKVTSIDVVNRNIDRTEMTIAVEYQYSKDDAMPKMGIDLASTEEPLASDCFTCAPSEIGKGSRNFIMFPVQLNVGAAQQFKRATLPTDKAWVYLSDDSGQKSYIFQATMMLIWHLPGAAAAPVAAASGNTVEINDNFKQNDYFSGYITVKYNLVPAGGRLRLRILDSSNPAVASYFASDEVPVKAGPGLQLVRIAVPKESKAPDVFNADTIEIQLLDAKGAVLASLQQHTPMNWAKPK